VFVEPRCPIHRQGFSNAAIVMRSRGRIWRANRIHKEMPACRASATRAPKLGDHGANRGGHAQGLGHDIHGVGRAQLGARASPGPAVCSNDSSSCTLTRPRDQTAASISIRRVSSLASAKTTGSSAARDNDRRILKPRGGHQQARGDLVAVVSNTIASSA
jgi:hypothetical protein